mmetsp:Transcript_9684/g.30119  ORF Transcript_9684/g.30119 Transcript_9684/m.30119 type:complete len:208 (-) Transcript_9684:869-1492(-)
MFKWLSETIAWSWSRTATRAILTCSCCSSSALPIHFKFAWRGERCNTSPSSSDWWLTWLTPKSPSKIKRSPSVKRRKNVKSDSSFGVYATGAGAGRDRASSSVTPSRTRRVDGSAFASKRRRACDRTRASASASSRGFGGCSCARASSPHGLASRTSLRRVLQVQLNRHTDWGSANSNSSGRSGIIAIQNDAAAARVWSLRLCAQLL